MELRSKQKTEPSNEFMTFEQIHVSNFNIGRWSPWIERMEVLLLITNPRNAAVCVTWENSAVDSRFCTKIVIIANRIAWNTDVIRIILSYGKSR